MNLALNNYNRFNRSDRFLPDHSGRGLVGGLEEPEDAVGGAGEYLCRRRHFGQKKHQRLRRRYDHDRLETGCSEQPIDVTSTFP